MAVAAPLGEARGAEHVEQPEADRWDTTITADLTGPKDANGLPLDYITGPNFGKATSNANYRASAPGHGRGRTFILAAGIRF